MTPHPAGFAAADESGIRRVVEAYHRHARQFDIEYVPLDASDFDLVAVHAGTTDRFPQGISIVAHTHGLYLTGDYNSANWEYGGNQAVINSVRAAREVTVPSSWIAEIYQRDMRFTPHVVTHGIDWQDFQHDYPNEGYILGFCKNRDGADVCDSTQSLQLARRFPSLRFLNTFAKKGVPDNVTVMGKRPHDEMKRLIQGAAVYVNTTPESGGITILEAMASGVPVLASRRGGSLDFVQHGVNGYLYQPDSLDDLCEGLNYCLMHRDTLGANGRELAKQFTWEAAMEKVAGVYRLALEPEPDTCAFVIPVFNKRPDELNRAILSTLAQTRLPDKVIVVDDGSKPENSEQYRALIADSYPGVEYIWQGNAGVAHARNNGIARAGTTFVSCLDSDDEVAPLFLERCLPALRADPNLGIAYTGLWWLNHDGTGGPGGYNLKGDGSPWPHKWDFDAHLQKRNQIPTGCVFRRKMWERLGGYRQRYAPEGAGAEDGEFWLRCGAYGWRAEQVTPEYLFLYHTGGQVGSNRAYREPPWLDWHPWTKDGLHPFASWATPKKMSHAVRAYDEPLISVVIPVGPGHENYLIDALDSLESQTFRKWEAIVVNDSGQPLNLTAYPYVRLVETAGQIGAGHARNEGVKIARANLLLFLDADDYLSPEAMQAYYTIHQQTGNGVYSDYWGKAIVAPEKLGELAQDLQERIAHYNEKTHEVIIGNRSLDYDPALAQLQPQENPYIFTLVTCLIPKAWFTEIGGFDEELPSWEDCDFYWRLARAGKCFTHITDPLMVYRFYTGGRRDRGGRNWNLLIEYLKRKYEGIPKMACNCGSKKTTTPPAPVAAVQQEANVATVQQASGKTALRSNNNRGVSMPPWLANAREEDLGYYKYNTLKKGDIHLVVNGHDYGYKSMNSAPLLMLHADARSQPGAFTYQPPAKETPPQAAPSAPPPPPQLLEQEPVVFRPPAPAIQAPPPPTSLRISEATQKALDRTETEYRQAFQGTFEDVEIPTAPTQDETLTITADQERLLRRATFKLDKLPGMTPGAAASLRKRGVTEPEHILALGIAGLKETPFLGELKARLVYEHVKDYYGA